MVDVIRRAIRRKDNIGDDLLVPRNEWVDAMELHGNDEQIISHPVVQSAFRKIVEIWTPRHRIAFISLCSSTRPYTTGKKWRKFRDLFSSSCDLFVSSNGGFIPLVYECQYPFLTYDAKGKHEFDDLYVQTQCDRFLTFFRRHKYDYILFQFRPNIRNRKAAEIVGPVLQSEGSVKGWACLPSSEAYEGARAERFRNTHYRLFPDLFPTILDEITNQVTCWMKEPEQ